MSPRAWSRLFAALAICSSGVVWAQHSSEVVLIKRAGVTAYEEATEEFGDRCRVQTRVVSFGEEGISAENGRIPRDSLVVTVGQEALDALGRLSTPGRSAAPVISVLAFHRSAAVLGPPASAAPELVLRLLSSARPRIRKVGAVYGPRAEEVMAQANKAAQRLGLTLFASKVASGPEAVRALRQLAKQVDALWLPGDPDILWPQVFQYALQLQLERGLPVAAATREQVHAGALLAVDFDPRDAGRTAADLANLYLEGTRLVPRGSEPELIRGARFVVNAQVARRLGVDTLTLSRLGARLE